MEASNVYGMKAIARTLTLLLATALAGCQGRRPEPSEPPAASLGATATSQPAAPTPPVSPPQTAPAGVAATAPATPPSSPQPQPTPPPTAAPNPAQPQADPSKAPAPGPPPIDSSSVRYSLSYDRQIREILTMTERGHWAEAEAASAELRLKAPEDDAVKRIDDWLKRQGPAIRDRALEERIRDIDSRQTGLNPNLRDLLLEKKERGLPSRKDIRDAVQRLEAIPYIPDSFGRTNRVKASLFDLETPQGRMAKILEKEISVHLDNVTLEAIIFNIGAAEGVNFVADKSIAAFKQTLSASMNKVKLGEFLRYVSRNLEVQFQVGEDLIWIIDAKDPKKLQEETRIYRMRRGFVLPAQFGDEETVKRTTVANNISTTVETNKVDRFVNDGALRTPTIERAIKDFFLGSKYLIDYERNLIVARGTREQLEVMDELVEEFDKPLQQVLIEARFITITEAAFLKLGASWETGRDTRISTRSPQDFTGLSPTPVGLGIEETFTNILSRPNLSATLTALQQDGESRTLSAPRLTLINNLPGRISDGKIQYYYEEYTVKQTLTERSSASSLVPAGKPAKITSGVTLNVLASIGGDGRSIMLALNPQVNQDVQLVPFATITDRDISGAIVSTFEIKLPESRTQELQTRVLVRSGQTVVMGGVLEREQSTYVDSVPILSRIPIIGAAFRKRSETDKPRYLLIFVTATLLSESGEFIEVEEEPAPPEPATLVDPAKN